MANYMVFNIFGELLPVSIFMVTSLILPILLASLENISVNFLGTL